MVHLVEPEPDDRICDPACGTAGFLISAAEYIRRKHEAKMTEKQWAFFDAEAFSGFDMDRTMLRISAMNLMLHAITRPNVMYRDSVSKGNEIANRFDVILANPPFSGVVDKADIVANAYDLSINKYKKTEYVAESYPPPSEILAEVAELEKQIIAGIAEQRRKVKDDR